MKTRIEEQAQHAERKRQLPYAVVCEHDRETIVFGYCTKAHGGGTLALAKLVPWAKNARVVSRVTETTSAPQAGRDVRFAELDRLIAANPEPGRKQGQRGPGRHDKRERLAAVAARMRKKYGVVKR